MRIPMLATGMLVSCLCTAAFGTDYVLDVSRMNIIQVKPNSLRTESIEIGIQTGANFHTRVRIRDEMVTVKGRLTEDKPGELVLKISVQFMSEVKNPDVLTGRENETSCSTTVGITAGKSMFLGGSITKTSEETRYLSIGVSLDRIPENQKQDTDRRQRIKAQYRKLIRDEMKARKTVRRENSCTVAEITECKFGMITAKTRPLRRRRVHRSVRFPDDRYGRGQR